MIFGTVAFGIGIYVYFTAGIQALITVESRARTMQSLSVHYRYRKQPIRINNVIKLYRYMWNYNFTLDYHTLLETKYFYKHIEFDLNYVELILCE